METATAQETAPRNSVAMPIRVALELAIDGGAIEPLLNELTARIQQIIDQELIRLREQLPILLSYKEPKPAAEPVARRGVEVTIADKQKAAELRTALLLGKLPDDTGVLIDSKVVARLLNVSARTLWRLDQEQAVPESVRVGRLIRWRLAELLEWIDSDCPPRRAWSYSGYRGKKKQKGR